MRQLNGLWAQHVNKAQKKSGHLFQGRFKANVIEKEAYLLTVLRYVVLNPVRAGICKFPRNYTYSSFLKTAGMTVNDDPVYIDWVLSRFGSRKKTAQIRYRKFVYDGIGAGSDFDDLKSGIFLGSDQFVTSLTIELKDERLKEIPKAQRPDPKPLLKNIIKDKKDKAGIYRAHIDWEYGLQEIANFIGVHYSTVSRAVKSFEGK